MSDEILLDEYDVVDGLVKKINNVPFVNDLGEPVYAVDVERVAGDALVIETTDGTRFTITCKGEVPDEHNARSVQGV